jgi:exosortase/archaeosortase family protein
MSERLSKQNHNYSLELWWANHAPAKITGFKFTILSSGLYALLFIPCHHALLNALSELIAISSNQLIHLLGENPLRDGSMVFSYRFSVNVAAGCTGAETISLFSAAVLLTPVPWASRFYGLALGLVTTYGINTLHISLLYLVGARHPSEFALFHEKIWPIIMIPLAVLMFLGWLMTVIPKISDDSPCHS